MTRPRGGFSFSEDPDDDDIPQPLARRPGEHLALDKLQARRDRLGKPPIFRSAYRSPVHNRAVGGATRSKHFNGAAFDIAMANHDPVPFEAAAREVGFLGFGFYPRSGFMHVDLGPARQWDQRFPVRETAFAADTAPARGVLVDRAP